jgi:AraC-like DNA-binding protein
MPLYMDIHSVPGVKSRDVAEAHRQDLLHQEEYGCNCMTYWIDEERESIFCLIEAADKDAVKGMHKKSHGLVPHKIIEVSSAIVKSFLGRIYDPDDAVAENGIKVFTDPSYRLLLLTTTDDTSLLRNHLGKERTNKTLDLHNEIVRNNIRLHNGSEAEHAGEGFIVSFVSAHDALNCALAIKKDLPPDTGNSLNFRIALNGGEPIEKSNDLFGDTIKMAKYLCNHTAPDKIAIAGKIRDIVSQELIRTNKNHFHLFSLPDEDLLLALYSQLEEKFHDSAFDVSGYAAAMSMSQPQLYRKAIALTGKSSNTLLKEFRLEKAKEFLKTQRYSISQVTFDSGFTSPSYFSKCFKTRFGVLPMEYLELVKSN